MRTRLLLAVATMSVCLGAGGATAHQATGPDPRDTSVSCGANVVVLGTGSRDSTLYLDIRDVAGFAPAPAGHEGPYLWSIWMYLETNGHPGMQTLAGSAPAVGDDAEKCTALGHTSGAGATPDTLLY